jgi:hypothetical protein
MCFIKKEEKEELCNTSANILNFMVRITLEAGVEARQADETRRYFKRQFERV